MINCKMNEWEYRMNSNSSADDVFREVFSLIFAKIPSCAARKRVKR